MHIGVRKQKTQGSEKDGLLFTAKATIRVTLYLRMNKPPTPIECHSEGQVLIIPAYIAVMCYRREILSWVDSSYHKKCRSTCLTSFPEKDMSFITLAGKQSSLEKKGNICRFITLKYLQGERSQNPSRKSHCLYLYLSKILIHSVQKELLYLSGAACSYKHS